MWQNSNSLEEHHMDSWLLLSFSSYGSFTRMNIHPRQGCIVSLDGDWYVLRACKTVREMKLQFAQQPSLSNTVMLFHARI